MTTDVIVLGAGMVGISAALHLQQRGRSVVLVDRRGAAEETSYGNTGIIQSEGIMPYAFPRNLRKLMRYGLNLESEAHLHYRALPGLAAALYRYWQNATPERLAAVAEGFKPLARQCIAEHEALMGPARVLGLVRRTGYLKLYPTVAALDSAAAEDSRLKAAYGVNSRVITTTEARELEPHLTGSFAGAIHMPDPVSVSDPGKVGKAYADLFVQRGGRFLRGEARSIEPLAGAWRVQTAEGALQAPEAVIALGAWSGEILKKLGLKLPLFVKRGYHMHYRASGNATLSRPVLDTKGGYVLTPMTKGIRLTTGAEFAERDAPATPVQLGKVEPMARALFPLAERVEDEPWLGRRPCLPDMLPVIGKSPKHAGLWLDFGHQHWGFTLGPVSGRLLAQMMTGETPLADPAPYRAERFS